MYNGEAKNETALTWSNIGKSLAGGVISGIGSWAVGRLLDSFFANGETIQDLLQQHLLDHQLHSQRQRLMNTGATPGAPSVEKSD